MSELIKIRRTCRLCDSPAIVMSVPLAQVPIVSPNVGRETDASGQRLTRLVAPLDNYLCTDCGLNQLVHIVDPSLIYGDYLYRTSVSLGLPEHFRSLAEAVIARVDLAQGDFVCEFGSNDGTLLDFFKTKGMTVQGVDPARRIASEATARGVPTLPEFFNEVLAERILAEHGPARAIISNNAMANIDGLAEILAGVRTLLADDGAFVFETQYALDMFEKVLLDVIYHEHISTFSVQPVVRAFERHGLHVYDAERIPTKGGSIRFWVQKSGGPRDVSERIERLVGLEQDAGLYDLDFHKRFGERVSRIRDRLHERIDAVRSHGGTVGAYGTSVGCAALIHQFELESRLDVLFDDTPFKTHLEGPGYSIPVKDTEGFRRMKPTLVIILAWRYAAPIMTKQAAFLADDGAFIIPLPDVTVRSRGELLATADPNA